MAEHTGLHYLTVCHYVNALHKQKLIRIADYEKDGRQRDTAALWIWGKGTDAKRDRMTAAERSKRYRKKKQAARLLAVQAGAASFTAAGNGRLTFTRNPQALLSTSDIL